jgi:hypothetical protein
LVLEFLDLVARLANSHYISHLMLLQLLKHIQPLLMPTVQEWINDQCFKCIFRHFLVSKHMVLLRQPILELKETKNQTSWPGYERTIPTELPPLVGEVIANFCGERVPRVQCDGSLRPYSRFLDRSRYFFFQVAPQLYSRG